MRLIDSGLRSLQGGRRGVKLKIGLLVIAVIMGAVGATAPQFTELPSIMDVGNDFARIHWGTDIPSTTEIKYGITETLGSIGSNNTNSTIHYILISGLTGNTTYYYNATSCDGINCTEKGVFSFVTTSAIPSPSASASPTPSPSPTASPSPSASPSASPSITPSPSASASPTPSPSPTASPSPSASPSPTPSPTTSPSPTPSPSPTSAVPTPPPTCIDTDNGKDYYTKASIIAGNEGGEDICESAEILKEYLCNDERTLAGAIRYKCPFGCKDGACIRENGTPTDTASPTPETREERIGFRTTVEMINGEGKTTIKYRQSFDSKFEGEMRIAFPFKFSEYNSKKVIFTPKPLIAKNDGEGNIEGIWEVFIEEGYFEIDLLVYEELEESIMNQFTAPIALEANEKTPSIAARVERAVIADENNQTNETAGSITGLTVVKGTDEASNNWALPILQILLLLLGVGAIRYFEKDLNMENEPDLKVDVKADDGESEEEKSQG